MRKTQNLNALLIEDDPITRKNYASELKIYFQNVYEASEANHGYEIYKENKPHIVIIDINLARANGINFLRKIRQNDQITKIIALSIHSSRELLFHVATLKLSVCLTKPVNRTEFRKALTDAIYELKSFHVDSIKKRNFPSIAQKKQEAVNNLQETTKILEIRKEQLQKFSTADKLTGLFIRKTDIARRWSEEKFIIICPLLNKIGALKLAQKLNSIIANHQFQAYNENITASIGICEYNPSNSLEKTSILCNKALCHVKNNGKNRAEIYKILSMSDFKNMGHTKKNIK